MKAAFLTSSLIAPKGKASPASPATTPTKLLGDQSSKDESGVSRIYQRVREYADPHHEDAHHSEAPIEAQDDSKEQEDKSLFAADETHEKEEIAAPIFDTESTKDDEIEDIDVVELKEVNTPNEIEKVIENHTPVREQRTISDALPQAGKGRYSVSEAVSKAMTKPSKSENLPEARVEEIATEVSKLKKDKLGRIRISVRMAPKDHLQLKLIAAHTQMSAQAIFETALEEYVANHGTELLPESCSCVLDKSTL
ncbi:MAG: hypothetical protein NXI13_02080 [Proteobacteria bacterium]|nr:hypothetical protein [Pseudomonadota bacterium]